MTSSHAIFRNPHLRDAFVRDGVVKVPLISAEEARNLHSLFEELGIPDLPHLRPSAVYLDSEQNVTVASRIRASMASGLESTFQNAKYFGDVFLTKGGGSQPTDLHQDWTAVDEAEFFGVNVWCALEDIGASNGAMCFLPGSHRWFWSIRSATIPSVSISCDDVSEHTVCVPLRAGEALVWDHRVLHGSLPNPVGPPRVVAQLTVLPDEAEHIHFLGDPEDHQAPLEVVAMNPSTIHADSLSLLRGQRPSHLHRVGERTHSASDYPSLDDLLRCLSGVMPRSF